MGGGEVFGEPGALIDGAKRVRDGQITTPQRVTRSFLTSVINPRTRTDQRPSLNGALDGAGGPVFYPLPAGRPHYEGLKSAFVNFPRLLRTLRNDRHTGYVRLSGTGSRYAGFILLHEGRVLEALCSNSSVTQGEPAFL